MSATFSNLRYDDAGVYIIAQYISQSKWSWIYKNLNIYLI